MFDSYWLSLVIGYDRCQTLVGPLFCLLIDSYQCINKMWGCMGSSVIKQVYQISFRWRDTTSCQLVPSLILRVQENHAICHPALLSVLCPWHQSSVIRSWPTFPSAEYWALRMTKHSKNQNVTVSWTFSIKLTHCNPRVVWITRVQEKLRTVFSQCCSAAFTNF